LVSAQGVVKTPSTVNISWCDCCDYKQSYKNLGLLTHKIGTCTQV
jgi:hypothetical protein